MICNLTSKVRHFPLTSFWFLSLASFFSTWYMHDFRPGSHRTEHIVQKFVWLHHSNRIFQPSKWSFVLSPHKQAFRLVTFRRTDSLLLFDYQELSCSEGACLFDLAESISLRFVQADDFISKTELIWLHVIFSRILRSIYGAKTRRAAKFILH